MQSEPYLLQKDSWSAAMKLTSLRAVMPWDCFGKPSALMQCMILKPLDLSSSKIGYQFCEQVWPQFASLANNVVGKSSLQKRYAR